jgi:hypothetical protein
VEDEEARRAIAPVVGWLESRRMKDLVVAPLVKQPAAGAQEVKEKLEIGLGILFERGIVEYHFERLTLRPTGPTRAVKAAHVARRPAPLFIIRRKTGHSRLFDQCPFPRV